MIVSQEFDVEFRTDGSLYRPEQLQAVIDGLQGLSNLVVLCHGWNNDMAEAAELYSGFLGSVEDVAEEELVAGLNQRRLGVVRVFWPSKRFADEELIPGGGAASATRENDEALLQALDALALEPALEGGGQIDADRRVQVERAKRQVPLLDTSATARQEFVEAIRALLDPGAQDADDGSAEFFSVDAQAMFQNFSGGVSLQAAGGGGGATSVGEGGAAGFVGDLLSGMKAGARRIANFATYYQMKQRAGAVGRQGVAPLLVKVRQHRADLPITLVGHSFGGRVVTAAAAELGPDTPAVTLLLLQAAFSHNGLSPDFDNKGSVGAFRTVLDKRRVSGPIVITHTKNDKAVGVAYPLASRIARDAAAALGDENDPYGGMGRNGAQRTQEAYIDQMHELDVRYRFEAGKVYNLRADRFIKNHSDVTGPNVAYVFAHLLEM